jgi:Flp pilus assembly pilin Flp
MPIMQIIKAVRAARRFIRDDSGAVTVDWVVLTAAVVILSIGAISALDGGIEGLTTQISNALTATGTDVEAEAATLSDAQ